eukprot:TRINITY_DN66291_c6_g1_i1.p1 TRINITY_DN66291_c6_g1~~TRINITY_DN66291_c6_g1_i1.p1  ORF type:complete len:316 (-),score=172.53 TRINITY_DN66291_c6_g1_i1:589-1536(-)
MLKKKMLKWDMVLKTELFLLLGALTFVVRCIDPFSFRNIMPRFVIEFARTMNGCIVISVMYWMLFGIYRAVRAISNKLTSGSRKMKYLQNVLITGNWIVLMLGVVLEFTVGPLWLWQGGRLIIASLTGIISSCVLMIYSASVYSFYNSNSDSGGGSKADKSRQATAIGRLVRITVGVSLLAVAACSALLFRGVAEIRDQTEESERLPTNEWRNILRIALTDHIMLVGELWSVFYFGPKPPKGEYGDMLREAMYGTLFRRFRKSTSMDEVSRNRGASSNVALRGMAIEEQDEEESAKAPRDTSGMSDIDKLSTDRL